MTINYRALSHHLSATPVPSTPLHSPAINSTLTLGSLSVGIMQIQFSSANLFSHPRQSRAVPRPRVVESVPEWSWRPSPCCCSWVLVRRYYHHNCVVTQVATLLKTSHPPPLPQLPIPCPSPVSHHSGLIYPLPLSRSFLLAPPPALFYSPTPI